MTGKCPDHPTVRLGRELGQDGVYVCPLDGKRYDFQRGFEKNNGEFVPGSTIVDQHPSFFGPMY